MSSTDRVAKNVFFLLLRDFRRIHGQEFGMNVEKAFISSIQEFREYVWPTLGLVDVHRFKAWHQLANLCKRHRFVDDMYTDDDLVRRTNDSFVEAQVKYAVYNPLSLRCSKVVREARRVCREILGSSVDEDELERHMHFGKRSSLGNPLESAYIDIKLSDPEALTCPTALRKWFFDDHLPKDALLGSIIKRVFKNSRLCGRKPNLSADYLNLVQVPKSWKINRAITPLSLIGLYYSYGIGGVVTDRLSSIGLNIKHLQKRHQTLAQKYSRTRTHATADLSRASDSLRSNLLNAVLPRAWYNALKRTFIRHYRVDDRLQYVESVLPMGNGATFPVETLMFYCIIKAVGNLLGVGGTYSVYGDDLIYPSKIHTYVYRVFDELGIKMNMDKTFVHSYFRESCGGDYYRGCDVRPALLPENTSPELVGRRYHQHIYKVINALLRRWSHEEIPSTLQWLELELAPSEIFQVPRHFPDTSGIKCDTPKKKEWFMPYSVPKACFINGQTVLRFRYLGTKAPDLRPVICEEPYYWETLKKLSLRRPPGWRFWDTFIAEVPPGEVTELFTVQTHRKTRNVLVLTPSRREGKVQRQDGSVTHWTRTQA